MISVIIVDYKTAERCVKYINDFCRTSDYKDVSFVVVDNTPNEENGNVKTYLNLALHDLKIIT